MGLSRTLFGFISLLVHWLQLMDWHTIIDNEDRKQERRIEVSLIVWSKTSLIEKAQRPARIEGQSDPKKAMATWDSNPARSDRMPLLYGLRYHRGPSCIVFEHRKNSTSFFNQARSSLRVECFMSCQLTISTTEIENCSTLALAHEPFPCPAYLAQRRHIF